MSDSMIRDSSICETPIRNILTPDPDRRVSPSSTPLHKFVEVKYKIDETFANVLSYLLDTQEFVCSVPVSLADYTKDILKNKALENFADSVRAIKSVLARDKMKVVFFGRTSNGKSTVVNAMLHAKVLPSGMGHTTRCFLQVEGSPSGEKYVLTEDCNEPKTLQSLDSLTNALCSKDMGEDALVRIMWPRKDSKLLTNEVVLVDSPGVDVSPEFDSWIDKHCLDADVFVLVSNAESTLTQTEKNFFHRVKTKLAKPNLFILNNRWDASAAEPEYMEQVRQQHMKQFLRFFVNELGVCNEEEAKKRVFFVSAREALQHRLKNKGSLLSPSSTFVEGHESRVIEFEEFERRFELCISQSAIETKFESHIKNGQSISEQSLSILDKLLSDVTGAKDRISDALMAKEQDFNAMNVHFQQMVLECTQRIQNLSAFVHIQVVREFEDEIRRLESIMDGYNKPFCDAQEYLESYKHGLVSHIEAFITHDLQVRLQGGLIQAIIEQQQILLTETTRLLPQEWQMRAWLALQNRPPFRFSFAIHFPSLMQDFQHQLQFSFSLSPGRLLGRLLSGRLVSSSSCNDDVQTSSSLFGSRSFLPKPVLSDQPTDSTHSADSMLPVNPIFATSAAAYLANGGVSLVLVAGLVFKTIGWRILVTGLSLYGLAYAYERLTWNNVTKERALKTQMRRHLTQKLQQSSKSIALSCDDQVSKEVGEVLSRMQVLTNEAHQEMDNSIQSQRAYVVEVEQVIKQLQKLKKRGILLNAQLDDFLEQRLVSSVS